MFFMGPLRRARYSLAISDSINEMDDKKTIRLSAQRRKRGSSAYRIIDWGQELSQAFIGGNSAVECVITLRVAVQSQTNETARRRTQSSHPFVWPVVSPEFHTPLLKRRNGQKARGCEVKRINKEDLMSLRLNQ
jgi:hypothetical protein